MRYIEWVSKVFHALAETSRGSLGGGVGLAAVGTTLGFDGLNYEDFAGGTEPARALMTAMYDLEKVGLVTFQNVDHGNELTPSGRDVLDAGLASVWPEVFAIPASEGDRTRERSHRHRNMPTECSASTSRLGCQGRTTRNTESSSGAR